MTKFSIIVSTTIAFAFVAATQELGFKGLALAITDIDPDYENSVETEEKDRKLLERNYGAVIYQTMNNLNSITTTLAKMEERIRKLEQSTNSITSTLTQLSKRIEKLEESSSSVTLALTNMDQRLEKVEHSTNSYSTLAPVTPTTQSLENLEVRTHDLTSEDIRALVSNPEAKLFRGNNFTGDSEDYNFLTSTYKGGCQNILGKLGEKVKSVDTLGKCVRVFSGSWCFGWSLALYPGSLTSHDALNTKLAQVNSVGPCLDEEFQLAYNTGKGNGDVRKNSTNIRKYFPDLVEFMSNDKYGSSMWVSNSKFSLESYKLGLNGRLEYVRAVVQLKHLNISPGGMNNTQAENIERPAIPVSIGGPGNETYNLVSQSPSARGELEGLAEKVRVSLGNNSAGKVWFYLNFMYESENDKTPYVFYYMIYYGNNIKDEVEYGRIVN